MTEQEAILDAVTYQRVWLAIERKLAARGDEQPCGATDAYAEWAIAIVKHARGAQAQRLAKQREREAQA